MDDFLLREAEHKEAVAAELEKSSTPAVLREAQRKRDTAAELRREWEQRQPSPVAVAVAPAPEVADTPEAAMLREYIVDAIKSCYDPEIPVNIYDLGLIYGIDIASDGAVHVLMTLTAPGCPAAGVLPGEVEQKVRSVPGVTNVQLDLVWDPPWDQNKMSQAARLQLGIDW
ncbi:MAG: SUF system Fe-S cluster assembly protein [Terriglobales bacterium]